MRKRGRPPKNPQLVVPAWSRRIADAREAAGFNQEKLAADSKLNQSSISEYERGQSEPSLAGLEAIARALGVSPAWLAYGEPDDSKTQDPLPKGYKDDRLFVWTFHQTARMLAEEGLDGDLSFLTRYARKFIQSAKGAADDSKAKESIGAAIEAERLEIRNGLDQFRKNLI